MNDTNTIEILKSLQELYLSKDYSGAAKLLIKNKLKLDPGLFHYNLGTVHSKMGNLAAGRYHLEKSLKNNFVNSKVLNNLNFVEQSLSVQDLSTSKNFYDRTIDSSLKFSGTSYLAVTLIFLVAVTICFKKKILVNRWFIGIFLALAITPISYHQFYLKNIKHAILLSDGEVREGPSGVFTTKMSIQAGSKVIVGEFEPGWVFIKYPLELSGWIKRTSLGLY